jgi:hypothetical protein
MMRRPSTRLILAATCAALVLGAAVAVAFAAGGRALQGAARTARVAPVTAWPLVMSAAPDDLALAQLSFRHAARGYSASDSSLRVAVSSPFGDDYLVAAALRPPTRGVSRVLVLLVNRPSPLLDPVSVRVRLTGPRALGTPRVLRLANPLARPPGARERALCDLPLHGSPLSASQLRPLGSRGPALGPFGAADAVAQAYDLACGLAHASSFAQAIAPASAPSPPTPPTTPTPTTPSPTTPSPPPPVRLPGEGCEPRPGYACPAAVGGASR